MLTLKEACQKILAARPGQYILCVNEYSKSFEFIMTHKGQAVDNFDIIMDADAVDKKDGKIRATDILDPLFQGNYKQYSIEDIEKLL